jgi:hypothetical protein
MRSFEGDLVVVDIWDLYIGLLYYRAEKMTGITNAALGLAFYKRRRWIPQEVQCSGIALEDSSHRSKS